MSGSRQEIPKGPLEILIIKTGAAGDVLRTTPLLRAFEASSIDWFVGTVNGILLHNFPMRKTYLLAENIPPGSHYDLVISLEDDPEVCRPVLDRIRWKRLFGAYASADGTMRYSEDSAPWFDMGLISRYGRTRADEMKLANRKSYQEIIFNCLGLRFEQEPYVMPEALPGSDLRGDIAVAPKAGSTWPNKNWEYYDILIERLSSFAQVTILPGRASMLEHLADIRNHKLVISNDSLPMHVALGYGIPTVGVFTCTSPWEIYDYGLLKKIVSPRLAEFFYDRKFSAEAVSAIPVDQVFQAVVDSMNNHQQP